MQYRADSKNRELPDTILSVIDSKEGHGLTELRNQRGRDWGAAIVACVHVHAENEDRFPAHTKKTHPTTQIRSRWNAKKL